MAGFKKSNNLEQLEQQVEEKNNVIVVQDKKETKDVDTSGTESNEKDLSSTDELILLKVLLDEKAMSSDLSKKRIETISLRISTDTLEKLRTLTKTGVVSQSDVFTMMIEKIYKEATNG